MRGTGAFGTGRAREAGRLRAACASIARAAAAVVVVGSLLAAAPARGRRVAS